MKGYVQDKMGNMLIACWESLGIMFDNMITELAEIENMKNLEETRIALREIATRHMPFFDKIDEMKMAVAHLGGPEDEAVREGLLNELDRIAKEGLEVKAGMEEVRKVIEGSSLSKDDKERMEREIMRCEETVSNLYSITIPAYTYQNFMALIRMEGAQHDITVMELSNGQYIVFYPAQHKQLMEYAVELATLSNQRHPSVGAVTRSAYFGSTDKSRAAVLRFEGLSAELAEKAVQEANFCSYVNFAKEPILGTDPQKYNLICEAGENQEDRNRNYRMAVEILARSAIAVSGPLKEMEEQKMRFESRKFNQLVEGLKSGSGYIYSVRDSERNNLFPPKEFIRFEKDPKNGNSQFFVNVNGVVTTTLYQSETERYDDQLYHMAQAGSGEKVYISDQEMEQMKETATQLYNRIQTESMFQNGLDLYAMSVQKSNEAKDLKSEKQYALAKSAEKESKEYDALSRACRINKKLVTELSKKEVLDGIISEKLYHSKFQAHVPAEIAKESKLIQRMAAWSLRENRKDPDNTLENNLRTESISTKEDFSIAGKRIQFELDRISIDKFIAAEYDRAKATEEEKKDDRDICIADVQQEAIILQENLPETLKAAKELFSDVRVRMIAAEVSLDTKDIDHIHVRSNSQHRDRLVNALEFGIDPDPKAQRSKDREQDLEIEKTQELSR